MIFSPASIATQRLVHRFLLIAGFGALCFSHVQAAHADCSAPHGVTSQIIYNTTHHVFQGCRADGEWVALGGGVADSGGGSPTSFPLSSVLATGNDAGNSKIINLDAPTNNTDAAHKSYVDGKFGTLSNNMWCRTNGTQIICDQSTPSANTPNLASVLAVGNGAGNAKITGLAAPTVSTDLAHKTYVDGKFGTLSNNMWCRTNGTQIICDQSAPSAPATPNLASVLSAGNAAGNTKITGLAAPTTGTDMAHKTYVDGKFGTLTNSRWCTSNGTQVVCNQTAPLLSESDPKIASTANNKWCRGTGSTLTCDQNPPTGDGDIMAALGCTTGQTVVKTAGGWGCADLPPVYANCTVGGETINHGTTREFFSAETHVDCDSIAEIRTCGDGVMSGSNTHDKSSCTTVRNKFFIMTSQTWNGNLGGVAGANAKCLSDLTNNDWRGKDTAIVNASTVKAFICGASGAECNNLQPNKNYVFARSGSTTVGGASFTTNASGLGPNSSTVWSGTSYFGVSASYWTNRDSGTSTLWNAHQKHDLNSNICGKWTSGSSGNEGEIGTSSATGNSRWANGRVKCNTARYLVCFVDTP